MCSTKCTFSQKNGDLQSGPDRELYGTYLDAEGRMKLGCACYNYLQPRLVRFFDTTGHGTRDYNLIGLITWPDNFGHGASSSYLRHLRLFGNGLSSRSSGVSSLDS